MFRLLKIERKSTGPRPCAGPRSSDGLDPAWILWLSSYCTGSPALVKIATPAGSKKLTARPRSAGQRLKSARGTA